MADTRRTFCRICIAACGMEITVDDDHVVGIRGDASHPLTHGYLCPKGRALGDAHHSPNRLNGALVGRGSERRAVSVDEAHEHLADSLSAVAREHGLGAVGVFHGTGAFQDALGTWTARRLKKELGTLQLYSTATVDAVAKTLVASEMAGTPLLIPNIDEEHGRLLVFVGINPVVSHGHATMFSNPVERIRAARRRGPVFTLDPRSTETARLSDHHLAVRPGTDYAVFAHAIRAVLDRGAVDPTALAERAAGVERLEAAVAAYDEATTSRITGVDRELLRAFVDAVVAAGRLAVLSGTGSTMSRSGNANEWLAWALMVLTNSFDEPGGMWFNPGAFTRLDRLPRLPEAAPSAPSAMSRPDIARCGGEWPASVIPDEIEAGRLRALIVLGANLITAVPGPERMARALADIDVLIVLDVQRNSTSDLATHVFACAGQLERPDVLPLELNANAVYQHYSEPVVTPRDDRPPMWQTMARIGAGVGLDVLGGVDPLATTTDEMLARMARGTALADLRSAGGLRVESGPVYGWVRSRLPFGRWDLAPERLVAQLEALDAPAPLVLTPRRLVKRMNWQLFRDGERHDALVHPDDAAEAGVADGDVVDVVSPVGSLRLAVRVSDTVVRGAVSIVHGFADANVNVLVDAHDLDPLTGMARLSGVPVTLTRLR